MTDPLESPGARDRAVNPVLGVVLIVGLAVVCSATLGTFLIGVGSGLDDSTTPPPGATVEIETLVPHDTDGFVTVGVRSLTDADAVAVTATTTDGSRAIADGTADGTARLTERAAAAGDSVTIREDVEAPRDVELRLVARAQRGDEATVVFDRRVVL